MIRRRLALLSPGAQALAQTAAVIGREFTFAVLARASGQDEAAVVQSLDELWRRQLVREQGWTPMTSATTRFGPRRTQA